MTEAVDTGTSGDPRDIRPLVARRRLPLGPWVFGAVVVVGATALFATLDANRRSLTAPATRPTVSDFGSAGSRVPELQLPVDVQPEPLPYGYVPAPLGGAQPMPPYPMVAQAPAPTGRSSPTFVQPSPPPGTGATYKAPPPLPAGPSVVYDNGAPSTAQEAKDTSQTANPALKGAERVRAGRLLNPSQTIVQGAIIQAVLETALDSTRPGMARAIVSRDVRGFDGARVLVPRGSRLVGEYQSDLSPGQNRALVVWTRLIRPDGVTINLQSPAADELGRAGVRGKVNTHFFERFGGAILQSALDLGVGLATRSVVGGTVIVGLPGSSTTIPQINPDNRQVRPTVTVKQGASVSVFVARDLDFSPVSDQP